MYSTDFMSVSYATEEHDSDIVCTYVTGPLSDKYVSRTLFSDYMQLIVRDDHPLASRDFVSLADLNPNIAAFIEIMDDLGITE